MPGPPVTIGCSVIVMPGASGLPDTGTIVGIFPPVVTANGMPLATAGSLCLMVNSLSGVTYPLVIGPLASTGVTVGGRALVRMGDRIPSPPGVLVILGPPAATNVLDGWPP
jgi:hypothetical protein